MMSRLSKRVARRIAICLLLGAVVNVAVAWAIAANPMQGDPKFDSSPTSSWRFTPHSDWPEATEQDTTSTLGLDLIMIDGGDQEIIWYKHCSFEPEPTAHLGSHSHHVNILEFGLPMRSMRTWSLYLREKREEPQQRFGFVSAEPLKKHGFARTWEVLPAQPIPLGFTINTLFYGSILFACMFSFSAARRYRRSRRGLCRDCAYDIAGLTRCPECGVS